MPKRKNYQNPKKNFRKVVGPIWIFFILFLSLDFLLAHIKVIDFNLFIILFVVGFLGFIISGLLFLIGAVVLTRPNPYIIPPPRRPKTIGEKIREEEHKEQ